MQVAPSVLGSDWRVIIDKDARLSLLLNAKSEIVAGAKLTSDDPNEVHSVSYTHLRAHEPRHLP